MKLKVYGYSGFVRDGTHVQSRMVVATTSKKVAAVLFRTTLHDLNEFGGETGNKDEIATAMSNPGKVFYRPLDDRGPFKEVP